MRKDKLFNIVAFIFMLTVFCFCRQAKAGQGPIVYWPMDENKGGIVTDKVAGILGYIDGAVWTEGIKNSALKFDGTKACVIIGPHKMFAPEGKRTVQFWARPDKVHQWGMPVAYAPPRVGPSSTSDWNKNKWCAYFRLGDIQFAVNAYHFDNRRVPGFGVSKEFSFTAGKWYCVAAVWDTDNGNLKLYINGNLVGQSDKIPANVPWKNTDAHQLVIGRSGAAETNYFCGIVDELCIYDRELSAKEIRDNFLKSQQH